MTLINCPECNNEISSKAEACPKCGYSQKKRTDKKQGVGCGTGCLVVIIFFIIVGIIGSLSDDSGSSSSSSGSGGSRSSSSSSSIVDLNASVSFSGSQFVIVNNDSFDWTNVKLEINPKTFSSGYVLKTDRMSAGETYTVGAMQFAKSDGEKFNPFTHKALKFSIWCDTPKGNGSYYGSWE